jgi:hypothetical protein
LEHEVVAEATRVEELAEVRHRFCTPGDLGRQRRVERPARDDPPQAPPRVQVPRRIDGAVVTEMKQGSRVNLEMQVGSRRERITGVTDEPDHLAGLHAGGAEREPRVAGEVRVVELVAIPVADPEAPAAKPLPPDPIQRPVRDRDHRSAEHREDVVAVMPAARDVAAGRPVRVTEVRLPGDRKTRTARRATAGSP